jgi:hypothetical protein
MDFWIGLRWLEARGHRYPKGVYFLGSEKGEPALVVFEGVANGSCGATYSASCLGPKQMRLISTFLEACGGAWFIPFVTRFRDSRTLPLEAVKQAYQEAFSAALVPYRKDVWPSSPIGDNPMLDGL